MHCDAVLGSMGMVGCACNYHALNMHTARHMNALRLVRVVERPTGVDYLVKKESWTHRRVCLDVVNLGNARAQN